MNVYINHFPLTAPSNVSAVYLGSGLMQIRWSHSGGATNFIIERKDITTSTHITEVFLAGGNEFLFNDYTSVCQRRYSYRVKAVDGTNVSEFSAAAEVFNWDICP
jgi:hypothetical protein